MLLWYNYILHAHAPYSQMAALQERASGQTRKQGVVGLKILQMIGDVTG